MKIALSLVFLAIITLMIVARASNGRLIQYCCEKISLLEKEQKALQGLVNIKELRAHYMPTDTTKKQVDEIQMMKDRLGEIPREIRTLKLQRMAASVWPFYKK